MAPSQPPQDNKQPSLITQILTLTSDQLELFDLEWHYERRQLAHRMGAMVGILVLVMIAFVLLQVALIHVLMRAGLAVDVACALLALVYLLVAGFLYCVFGRRDPRVGEPFEASRRELGKNIRWIQKHFS